MAVNPPKNQISLNISPSDWASNESEVLLAPSTLYCEGEGNHGRYFVLEGQHFI